MMGMLLWTVAPSTVLQARRGFYVSRDVQTRAGL